MMKYVFDEIHRPLKIITLSIIVMVIGFIEKSNYSSQCHPLLDELHEEQKTQY